MQRWSTLLAHLNPQNHDRSFGTFSPLNNILPSKTKKPDFFQDSRECPFPLR